MTNVQAIPYHECDRQGLACAYSSPTPFIRDGLLFYLKAGHYQLGPTPLVLLWKDERITRYPMSDGRQVRRPVMRHPHGMGVCVTISIAFFFFFHVFGCLPHWPVARNNRLQYCV